MKVSKETAQKVGDKLGVQWNKIDLKQFTRGMNVEQEHSDVTKGNLLTTGKIAHAHLKEVPDYYSKLKKVENDMNEKETKPSKREERLENERYWKTKHGPSATASKVITDRTGKYHDEPELIILLDHNIPKYLRTHTGPEIKTNYGKERRLAHNLGRQQGKESEGKKISYYGKEMRNKGSRVSLKDREAFVLRDGKTYWKGHSDTPKPKSFKKVERGETIRSFPSDRKENERRYQKYISHFNKDIDDNISKQLKHLRNVKQKEARSVGLAEYMRVPQSKRYRHIGNRTEAHRIGRMAAKMKATGEHPFFIRDFISQGKIHRNDQRKRDGIDKSVENPHWHLTQSAKHLLAAQEAKGNPGKFKFHLGMSKYHSARVREIRNKNIGGQ